MLISEISSVIISLDFFLISSFSVFNRFSSKPNNHPTLYAIVINPYFYFSFSLVSFAISFIQHTAAPSNVLYLTISGILFASVYSVLHNIAEKRTLFGIFSIVFFILIKLSNLIK